MEVRSKISKEYIYAEAQTYDLSNMNLNLSFI